MTMGILLTCSEHNNAKIFQYQTTRATPPLIGTLPRKTNHNSIESRQPLWAFERGSKKNPWNDPSCSDALPEWPCTHCLVVMRLLSCSPWSCRAFTGDLLLSFMGPLRCCKKRSLCLGLLLWNLLSPTSPNNPLLVCSTGHFGAWHYRWVASLSTLSNVRPCQGMLRPLSHGL
jgi:hypothetical protein